jgi:flagellar hook-length control protein FliK
MPTTPSLLDPKPPQLLPSGPPAAKTAFPVKFAADFRQALAAIPPVNADGAKPAAVPAAQTILPQLPAIAVEAVADKLQRIAGNPETPIVLKRLKKALAQKPAATASPPAAPPPSTAALPVAASTEVALGAPAVPAARAPDSSMAAPPLALPSPAAAAAVTPVRPDPVPSANKAKPTPATAPEKPAVTPTIATHVEPNGFSLAAASPPHASHGLAKAAAITRQIAAALPRVLLTNPGNPPALHISLTPETLGTITIKIAQHASGETSVTLTASLPETLAALKQDAHHLDQVLTNAGIPDGDRQVHFQTMPVAATQAGPGLGNAGGQSAGGLLAGGQLGQGNGNAQQQQAGTAFASSMVRPVAAPVVEAVARPRSNHAGRGVDVIA